MKVKVADIGREHIGMDVVDRNGVTLKVSKVCWYADRVALADRMNENEVFFLIDDDQPVEFIEPTKTVELNREEVNAILRLLPDRWQQGDVAGEIRWKLDNL